jgi:SulP family sulfate permease
MVVTFAATLALSVEQSVLLGIILSATMYLYHASQDVHVMEMVATPDGDFEEHPAPAQLPNDKVTVINLYGSLFFAAAELLEAQLPSARNARRAVVIIRLRGRSNLGSTIYNVLERYAERLAKHGGKLILSGISDTLYQQLVRTDLFKFVGEAYLTRAERRPSAAMRKAIVIGEAWLRRSS